MIRKNDWSYLRRLTRLLYNEWKNGSWTTNDDDDDDDGKDII